MKKENLFPMPYTTLEDLFENVGTPEKLEEMLMNLSAHGFTGIECKDVKIHHLTPSEALNILSEIK